MVGFPGGPNRTRSNVPEEEEHPRTRPDSPEEEEYTRTRTSIPEEEEEHPISSHENIERAAHDWNPTHTRSRSTSTPEKDKEHPISSHENIERAAHDRNPTHNRSRSTSTPEKDKEHPISSHEKMQPAAQEDVDQQMKAAREGPSYSVTMSTGVPTTDQQKRASPESVAQPQLRDDTGKKRQGGELTCSTDTESRDLTEIISRKQTMEEEREHGEDLILPRFNDEDSDEEGKIRNSSSSYQTLAEGPAGDLQAMVGDVTSLGVSMKDDNVGMKWKGMFDFMRAHNRNGSVVADMVLLNLPSGLPVSGVDDEHKSVPSWNKVTPSLIANGLLVASKILSHTGFLVCIHTYHQNRLVNDEGALELCGLQFSRAFVLTSSKPIYYQLHRPHTKIHTLIVSLFHHRGEPPPRPYYSQAAQVDSAHCSLSRNSLEEDKAEFEQRADGRGGAERSHTIWRFLLQAFSKCGDTVVDLIAGSGSFIKIASELGRHAFGLDPHDHIMQTIC